MKELTTAIIMLLILGLILVPDYKRDKSRPIEIVVDLCCISPQTRELFTKFFKSYMETHPRIKITPRFIASRANMKMMSQVTAGSAADIMCVHYTFFQALRAKGAFLPLKDIPEFNEKDLEDFYETALGSYSWEGVRYGMPFKGSALSMIYNRALFKKCGIPEPSSKGWTWTQFADAVRTLGVEEGVAAGFIIDQQINNWVPWFWNNGGPGWFSKEKLVCSLSSKINVDTISFVLGLGLKDKAAKLRTDVMNLSVTASPFEEGKVGVILGGPWMLPRLKAAAGLDWDVAPMPTIRPGMDWSSRYAGMGFSIYSGSRHPSICWDIIKYITSPQAQKEMVTLGEDIPARISVAEKEFIDPDTPWREEFFLDAVRHSRPVEEVPNVSEVNAIFGRHLDLIWLGKESVEEGCHKMTKEINKSLMRNRRKHKRWVARHGGRKS